MAARICFQCRNRKVRCDGGVGACENCRRLQFVCSFSNFAQEASKSLPNNDLSRVSAPNDHFAHNYSGLERKHTARACLKCQIHKSKCSGESPACQRCRERGLECQYDKVVRAVARRTGRKTPQRTSKASNRTGWSAPVPHHVDDETNTSSSSVGSLATSAYHSLQIGPTKAIMGQHIDAFFEYIYPIPCQSFLHQSTFLRNWIDGTDDPSLLRAICGASARYISSNPDHSRHAALWIEQAEEQIFILPSVPILSVQRNKSQPN